MHTSKIAVVACAALLATLACGETDTDTGGSGGGGFAGSGGTGGAPSNGPFTLTMNGTGYRAHAGGKLRAALVNLNLDQVAARLEPPVIVEEDGTFSFEMGDILKKDVPYRVDYFAELAGKGTPDQCDPADHRWSESIAPVAGEVTITVTHQAKTFSDVVCQSFQEDPGPFDLRFIGSNYTSHVGEDVRVKLVDVETNLVEATLDEPVKVAPDATWAFEMKEVLRKGVTYKLVYFADHNLGGGSAGVCDDPPIDHVWNHVIENVQADVVVQKEHLAQFDETACAYFR